MIIVGYPGIGKSTLCQHRENCIDLESSCFDKSNKNDWLIAIEAMANGKIPADKMITHRFPLEKLHDALEVMRSRQFNNKVMIVMD